MGLFNSREIPYAKAGDRLVLIESDPDLNGVAVYINKDDGLDEEVKLNNGYFIQASISSECCDCCDDTLFTLVISKREKLSQNTFRYKFKIEHNLSKGEILLSKLLHPDTVLTVISEKYETYQGTDVVGAESLAMQYN